MKDLSKEQQKLVEDLVHPEKDAFIEWYTGEFNHDWQLVDLRNKPKIAEETIKNIKQLKSSGLTFDQIRQLIQEQETKMWDEINEEYWWIEKEDMFEEYKAMKEPDANYHKLGWTMRLVDALEEIEKEEKFQECQRRQAEMDACIQPRTPTYEYLTVKQQREQYAAIMPPRIRESHQIRALYTDYDERNDS